METSRKGIGEMFGDAFRETAILVIVFAPLDRWVERRAHTERYMENHGIRGYSISSRGVVLERLRRV